MSLNQISGDLNNTYLPPVSFREVNISNNINFGTDVKINEPSSSVLQVTSNEFKWVSVDGKDHFKCVASGPVSKFEFSGDHVGGLNCDFKCPSSDPEYDLRIAIANIGGNYILNRGDILFQDNNNNQELVIKSGTNSGIALPNLNIFGYIPSTLNCFEEISLLNLTVSGCISGTTNFKIQRIGSKVTITGTAIGITPTTSSDSINILSALPPRFRPNITTVCPIQVSDGANVLGCVLFFPNGDIKIYVDIMGGLFLNPGFAGYASWSCDYLLL